MANQKKAQGGYPENKSAVGDEHSTTGDGHPPRKQSKGSQAKTGKGSQSSSRQKK
jgi:hypothetical protein